MRLNGLSLAGAFTTPGTGNPQYSFTLLVTDAAGMTAGTGANFNVVPHIAFTGSRLPVANTGSHYDGVIGFASSLPPGSVAVVEGQLPPGLTAAATPSNTIVFNGTVMRSARTTTYTFTLKLTDKGICGPTSDDLCSVTAPFSIAVQ
jgi:hypothetical protein